MKFLFIILFLFSCANLPKQDIFPKDNNPYFDSYRLAFETYMKEGTSHIPIVFGEIEGAFVLAHCITYSNGSKAIEVDPSKWDRLSEISRELLITHELGHCHLYRNNHTDDKNKYGMPLSIMNTYILFPYYYKKCKKEYLHELKTQSTYYIRKCLDNL